MSRIIELAKKLNALAKEGVGGEKVNASALLEKLMAQHNFSMGDIEGEVVSQHSVVIEDKYLQLFQQIAACVIGINFRMAPNTLIFNNYFLMGTAAQIIEVELRYDFYLDLYKKEQELFFIAFVGKNNLIPAEHRTMDFFSLSREDQEKQIRIQRFAREITQRDYIKGINE